MTTSTEQPARAALTAAIGPERVRDAGADDAVGGVTPRWVATVDGTERAAAAMRAAAEHGLHVVPRGSGSRIDWGAAPNALDLVLDLSQASGVLEHAAGDLVLRARAGTPISEVQRTVRAAGQQLSVDTSLPSATVGGVIATGTTGPGRLAYGGVRDLLIGITVVRADGVVTISGGKVVKNVAGYDLGKLYTGSHGTLGVITEAFFRLHPLAAEQRWIRVDVPDPETAGELVGMLRGSREVPTAVELDRPEPHGPITVCAQLEGRPETTHERAGELARYLGSTAGREAEVSEGAPPWWGHHPFDSRQGTGLRLSVPPAALASLITQVQHVSERSGVPLALRGSAGLGLLDAGVPDTADARAVGDLVGELRTATGAHGGHAVVLRARPEVAAEVEPWGPVPDGLLRLMRRTKDQFDPDHRLSPGRFVGGL